MCFIWLSHLALLRLQEVKEDTTDKILKGMKTNGPKKWGDGMPKFMKTSAKKLMESVQPNHESAER